MIYLNWEEWMPLDRCIKAEGAEMIWFINPTPDEKWYLAQVRKKDRLVHPEKVGIFRTIQEAMDNAQKLENAKVH